jgi:actin-related protein
MYASGKTSGIVLDIGYGTTHAVPIYEGYQIPHAIMKLELGGDDITKNLKSTLNNHSLSYYEIEMIKEQTCFVPEDYDYELRNQHDEQFELPDGQTLVIGA